LQRAAAHRGGAAVATPCRGPIGHAGGTQAWRDLAEENGFLLIVPNGTNARIGDPRGNDQNWNDCRSAARVGETKADDVGFIIALVEWAQREMRIDPLRVYATGASNGGGMSYRLAIERPDRFAAVAVFIMCPVETMISMIVGSVNG
jgi:polyhydroxybutyrate depolymerase